MSCDSSISVRQRSSAMELKADCINELTSKTHLTTGPVSHQTDDDVASDSSDESGLRLKRKFGLIGGVALIVGGMIGSGIFISPGNVLRRTQSPGLCLTIWAVCGFYSLLGALSYCELGTLIPKSGGDEYAYFLEAFGPMHSFFGPILAFLFAWVNIALLKPSSVAILALSFGKYLTSPILTLINICPDRYLNYVITRLVACACIILTTFINCYSVKVSSRVQIVFTVAKLTAILIIICGGFYYIGIGNTDNLEVGFEGSTKSFSQIVQAFYGGLWAYGGWNSLNIIIEELKDPIKNLPRSILIGVPLVTCCYVLVNVAYLAVLTPQEIITSDAVAVDWAYAVLGGAAFLIPLGVVMSVFGTTNGSVLISGRISYAAAREGHIFALLSYVHIERETPTPPMLLNSFIAILMIIPSNLGTLIDFFGFTISIIHGVAMVALLVMRFTRKDQIRPIKVPIIIPIVFMLISACLVFVPIVSQPEWAYFFALLFILAGLVFYVPFVYYKKVLPGIDMITIFFQKLLLVAPTTTHRFALPINVWYILVALHSTPVT